MPGALILEAAAQLARLPARDRPSTSRGRRCCAPCWCRSSRRSSTSRPGPGDSLDVAVTLDSRLAGGRPGGGRRARRASGASRGPALTFVMQDHRLRARARAAAIRLPAMDTRPDAADRRSSESSPGSATCSARPCDPDALPARPQAAQVHGRAGRSRGRRRRPGAGAARASPASGPRRARRALPRGRLHPVRAATTSIRCWRPRSDDGRFSMAALLDRAASARSTRC